MENGRGHSERPHSASDISEDRRAAVAASSRYDRRVTSSHHAGDNIAEANKKSFEKFPESKVNDDRKGLPGFPRQNKKQ
jgi:hypothetical protein